MKKKQTNKVVIALVYFLAIFISACGGSEEYDYYPKPRGFIRLDFPENVYERYTSDCPYTFELPDYMEIIDKENSCHKDIVFERFNGIINLTYVPLDSNLMMNIELSRRLAYEHSGFADAIEEAVYMDPISHVYGLRYNIIGNAASPYQFYMTDSVNHFLRGALYFNTAPNYDSIKPSLDYVVKDIDYLIETIHWVDHPDTKE